MSTRKWPTKHFCSPFIGQDSSHGSSLPAGEAGGEKGELIFGEAHSPDTPAVFLSDSSPVTLEFHLGCPDHTENTDAQKILAHQLNSSNSGIENMQNIIDI